jgi:hypothetical protein
MTATTARKVFSTLSRLSREIEALSRLVATETGQMERAAKECNQCGRTWTMKHYHLNRTSPDGRCSICKYCISGNKKAKNGAKKEAE